MAGIPPIQQANEPSINSTQPLTVEFVPGHLRMHTISEDKLDMLVSGNAPLHLTFFGFCFGAAISFGVVLRTVNLEINNKSLFGMLFFVSLIMGAYFGIRGCRDHFQSKNRLDEIKGLKKSN